MREKYKFLSDNCPPTRLAFVLSLAFAAWGLSGTADAAWFDNAQLRDHKQTHAQEKEPTIKLATVTVEETSQETGQAVIGFEQLQMQPSTTGTVTDALRGESFIQFDRNFGKSGAGANVAAPLISINGSKPYENNFSIDGMSNNNSLNPGSWTEERGDDGFIDPHGDTASLMLQTDLLDAVEVYTENVPVKYGEFTGGVVDARLRDAQTDKWHGAVSVRHSQDSWARQHLYGNKANAARKAQFKRTRYNVRLEGPLGSENLGAIINVSRHTAKSPYFLYQDGRGEVFNRRTNDNLMLRINARPNADLTLSGAVIYAPYNASRYTQYVKDSHFRLKGGGIQTLFNLQNQCDFGVLRLSASYMNNEVSRESDSNHVYRWKPTFGRAKTPSSYADWPVKGGYVTEGSYGDVERRQQLFSARGSVSLNAITLGATEHLLDGGFEVSHQTIKRDLGAYTNEEVKRSYKKDMSHLVGDISDGIIAGEQLTEEKKVYRPQHTRRQAQKAAVYLQDRILVDRFEFRPAVRVSWDSVSHNVDVAPRLFMDMDILNDRRFHVNLGLNRYYGSEIVGNYLYRNDRLSKLFKRSKTLDAQGRPGPWKASSDRGAVKSRLNLAKKNPHSDEVALGASADILGGTFINLTGVYRRYKDQLIVRSHEQTPEEKAKHINYIHEVVNGGESTYKGVTLALSKQYDLGAFGNHHSRLSMTYSRVHGAGGKAGNWIEAWDETQNSSTRTDPDFAVIDGRVKARSDLDANNFNADWALAYTHSVNFFNDRLRTMWLLRWSGPSDHLVLANPGQVTVEGFDKPLDNFKIYHAKSHWNMDMNAEWDIYKRGDIAVTLDLQVQNLFNKMSFEYDASTDNTGDLGFYMMGRQYYLGLKATF